MFAAVNDLHAAFSRAENRRIPDKPKLDINDAGSLERRARWLREVAEVMQRVESGPQEIGAAIRGLEAVLLRFNDEMESARMRGTKGNTSALRWLIPLYPAMVVPGQAGPRPAQPKDELAWLYR